MSEPTISNLIRNVNVTFITWVRSPGDFSGFQLTGMIEGFFTVGLKFFLGFQNNMRIHNSTRVSPPSGSENEVQQNLFCFVENYKNSEIRHGIFWGVNF